MLNILIALALLSAVKHALACDLPAVRRSGWTLWVATWIWLLCRLTIWLPFTLDFSAISTIGIVSLGVSGTAVLGSIAHVSLRRGVAVNPSPWMLATMAWVCLHVLLPLIALIVVPLYGQQVPKVTNTFLVYGLPAIAFAPSMFIAWAAIATRRRLRSGAATCWSCGYSLHGLSTEVCPECGCGTVESFGREAVRRVRGSSVGSQIVVAAILGSLAWVQLPDSGMLQRFPLCLVLAHAKLEASSDRLNWKDRDWASNLQQAGLEPPTRSFTDRAMLAQLEIVRRIRARIISAAEVNEIKAAGFAWITQRRVAARDWHSIMFALNDAALLPREDIQRLFNVMLEYRLQTRSRFAPGDPVPIEITVHSRTMGGESGQRLPDLHRLCHDLDLVVEELSINGVSIATDLALHPWRPMSFGVGGQLWRIDGTLPRIPVTQLSGPATLTVRLRCCIADERVFNSEITPQVFDGFGLTHLWPGHAARTVGIVPSGIEPLVRVADSKAAEIFVSEQAAVLAADVVDSEPGIYFNPHDLWTRARCSTGFAFDAFAFDGVTGQYVGAMTFDPQLRSTSGRLTLDPSTAMRLHNTPESMRLLVLVPSAAAASQSPRDDPIYDGPSLQMPLVNKPKRP